VLQLSPSAVRVWNELRITSPEQTWCDLAPALTVPDLVAAGDYLIHWRYPIATVESLSAATVRRTRHRGVVRLRQALPRLNDRSESPQESKLRVIVMDAGIPGVEANYWITTSGGHHYRADLAIPHRRLLFEYQSAFHETPESFRSDMTRVSRLEADEWKVMQLNKDDIAAPVELVARIRRVLALRPYFTV
jgi:very-short-patch-repair endonuclease